MTDEQAISLNGAAVQCYLYRAEITDRLSSRHLILVADNTASCLMSASEVVEAINQDPVKSRTEEGRNIIMRVVPEEINALHQWAIKQKEELLHG